MDIMTDKSGILIKIGIKIWQIESCIYLGLNHELVEQSLFNYYKWKREVSMSKIVKDGSKEDLFEYYPKLFQKLLEWSPDGSINKRNLIDINKRYV